MAERIWDPYCVKVPERKSQKHLGGNLGHGPTVVQSGRLNSNFLFRRDTLVEAVRSHLHNYTAGPAICWKFCKCPLIIIFREVKGCCMRAIKHINRWSSWTGYTWLICGLLCWELLTPWHHLQLPLSFSLTPKMKCTCMKCAGHAHCEQLQTGLILHGCHL